MARCPYLDYESNGIFSTSSDKYVCKLTGRRFDSDDQYVKYTCKTDYGDNYEQCPVYKDRR